VAEAKHEDSDVDVKAIATFAIGLVVAAAIIHGLVWLLFVYFTNERATSARLFPLAATQESQLPPEPRLQTTPRLDLLEMRAHEDELLTGYSWVNKDAGVVRIPIDQAMRIVVERGLPARTGNQDNSK